MATTNVFNGSLIGVYLTNRLIALGKSCTLNVSVDEMDVTSKDSALWGEFRPTVKHWDVSCDHLMKLDGTRNVDSLMDKLIAGTSVHLKFQTAVSGDVYWHGTAYVVSISMNAAQNEPASFTVNFKGTSTLTNATVT